jgi:SAM-dependent methyltransferase
LAFLARRYIALRLLISGHQGESLPIGELPDNQKLVVLCSNILKDHGLSLEKQHIVLDFGCGTGRHTYEFRDRGYQAFGFDTNNYITLRHPDDNAFFLFPETKEHSRVPTADGTFDFLFSNHVLEHTLDYKAAFQEMQRILKPGGSALHIFPSRLRIIEPHMYVPFAGRFQSYSYFLFWAALGVRSEIQAGKSRTEAARMNLEYARRGVHYLTKRQILRLANRYFEQATFVEASFVRHTRQVSWVSCWVYSAMQVLPWVSHLYGNFHTRVLLLQKDAKP